MADYFDDYYGGHYSPQPPQPSNSEVAPAALSQWSWAFQKPMMRDWLLNALYYGGMALPGRSRVGAGIMPDHIRAMQLERRLPTMDGFVIANQRTPTGGFLERAEIPIDPGITGGAVNKVGPGEYNWMDFGTFSRYPEVAGSAHGLAKRAGVVSARDPAPPREGMDWPPANATEMMRYRKMGMDQERAAELRARLELLPGGRKD